MNTRNNVSPEYEVTSGNPDPLYPASVPELVTPFLALATEQNDRINALKAQIIPNSDVWGLILEKLRVDWTYHSNAIEGSALSRGETMFFLTEGLTVEGKPFKDFLDAKNHAEAIDLLMDIIANARPITEGVIKEINALLLYGIKDTEAITPEGQRIRKPLAPGEYKIQPNHVLKQDGTLHQYVSPEQVPVQMESLIQWININIDQLHPIVVAAVAHYNLVRIHPFGDGNGRGARILMNMILLKKGYFPAVIYREQKRKYLEVLEQADQGNLEPFIQFITSQLIETQQRVIGDLEKI